MLYSETRFNLLASGVTAIFGSVVQIAIGNTMIYKWCTNCKDPHHYHMRSKFLLVAKFKASSKYKYFLKSYSDLSSFSVFCDQLRAPSTSFMAYNKYFPYSGI